MTAKKSDGSIDVIEFRKTEIEFAILGTSPVILNRMSEKAMRVLLAPAGRKTAAEKQSTMKHDPYAEFRASPYMIPDKSAPTLLAAIAPWFKKGISGAAIDMGAKRTQIGRLVHVVGERLPLYGVPRLLMSVTRSADINRTPDVRTRAIVPEWACYVSVSFPTPVLNQQIIANLLAAAGQFQGVGDWRPEKGAGAYGQYEIVSRDDPRFLRVIESGGRAAQADAMACPVAYDEETSDLLEWYGVEAARRGFEVVR